MDAEAIDVEGLDIFEQFAADEQKEIEGVDCQIGGGAILKVARSGNKKYARKFQQLYEKHQRTLDLKNAASDDLADQIMIAVMAETVLLGWTGIKYKGKTLPYSVDNAKMLLAVKDFRALVSKLSGDFETYRLAQKAEAEEN